MIQFFSQYDIGYHFLFNPEFEVHSMKPIHIQYLLSQLLAKELRVHEYQKGGMISLQACKNKWDNSL